MKMNALVLGSTIMIGIFTCCSATAHSSKCLRIFIKNETNVGYLLLSGPSAFPRTVPAKTFTRGVQLCSKGTVMYQASDESAKFFSIRWNNKGKTLGQICTTTTIPTSPSSCACNSMLNPMRCLVTVKQ